MIRVWGLFQVSSSLYLLRGMRGVGEDDSLQPFRRLFKVAKSGSMAPFLDSSIQLVKDDHACVTLKYG